jgi:hypothetical protein
LQLFATKTESSFEPSEARMLLNPPVRDVIAYAATTFADDPDEETSLFAREVLRLLDTDARRQQALQLVRAYMARPAATRSCQTLAEIETILSGDFDPAQQPERRAQEGRVQELLAAAHHVAALAVEAAATFPQRELRSQCMRIAMRCETDASRLKQQLIWSSE